MLNVLKLRSNETGNPKIDKIWATVRHLVTTLGGFLISLGISTQVTIDDLNSVFDVLSLILDGGYELYGLLLFAWGLITSILEKSARGNA